VVGRVVLDPPDPLDSLITSVFNDHQRRITQRGRLLGPDAAAFAAAEFGRLGTTVLVRSSPWRLGPSEADLAAEWLAGWLGAAREQQPELAAETDIYKRRRLRQADAGQLAIVVDHADLLVLPDDLSR
jgi:hypothetical protein